MIFKVSSMTIVCFVHRDVYMESLTFLPVCCLLSKIPLDQSGHFCMHYMHYLLPKCAWATESCAAIGWNAIYLLRQLITSDHTVMHSWVLHIYISMINPHCTLSYTLSSFSHNETLIYFFWEYKCSYLYSFLTNSKYLLCYFHSADIRQHMIKI